ncbi:MAG TPA: glycerophosphodiester phosphodiesterase family protein [Longimicrobium sp.]
MRFPDHPLILGHRGAPREAPENTLRAFRLAREHGADGVELDVQPSADGVPIVIHDPTLDRTTDSGGLVAALPWDRLSAVSVGGEPLARLESVAEWAAESGAWLNVEIKSAGIEAASVAAIEAAGLIPRTFFSSFLPEVVARVGEVAPHATRFFLTEEWSASVLSTARELGVSGVCLHHPLATPSVLAELRAASLDAVVWTVDEPARIRDLLRAGVRAIITNDPALAVTLR